MNKLKIASLIIFGFLLTILIYGVWIEPYWIEVSHLQVENESLGDALRGKTAVHLSDLHIQTIGKREQRVLKIIEEISPDFIFLTGDYIPWDGAAGPALDFLSRLKARFGVWAVMGDYDYSNSRKSCLFCHEKGSGKPTQRSRVRFLRNSVKQINLYNGKLWIGGVDGEFKRAFASEDKLFAAEKNFPSVILSHNPLSFDALDEDKEVLVLAGDTHGGQIPIPSWLWKILGYEKNAKYNQGLFKEGRKMMYVSKGVGMSHLPIRIMRRPEIVVLHF